MNRGERWTASRFLPGRRIVSAGHPTLVPIQVLADSGGLPFRLSGDAARDHLRCAVVLSPEIGPTIGEKQARGDEMCATQKEMGR